MAELERFIEAQGDPEAGFDTAMAELRGGRKRGHWIWYVFPQLRGLGRSPVAQFYGLTDVAEAERYLRHPVLGDRLLAAARIVLEQIDAGIPLRTLMGSEIDTLKLVSSMTLFGSVARRMAATEPALDVAGLSSVAEAVLAAAEAGGFSRCTFTSRACDGRG